MTREPIELAEIERIQGRLIEYLLRAFTKAHREFLLSLVRAEPQWELLPFEQVAELPATQLKLRNLQHLHSRNPARFEHQHETLA